MIDILVRQCSARNVECFKCKKSGHCKSAQLSCNLLVQIQNNVASMFNPVVYSVMKTIPVSLRKSIIIIKVNGYALIDSVSSNSFIRLVLFRNYI